MISINDIIDIHDSVEENQIILNRNNIESSLSSFHYYETKEEQIISIFTSLLMNHAFMDGNKRTAVVTLSFLLDSNNFIIPNDDILYDIAIGYINRKYNKEDLLKIIFKEKIN